MSHVYWRITTRKAASPAFGKAHAHDLQFRGQIIQEIVGCGMESQCRRHKIDERRSLLQNYSLKITIASDLTALQLPSYTQPIVRGLQWQMNVLTGLQFNNRKPSGARYSQQIENAVFSACIGKNLGVDVPLIEHGIDARDVLANNGIQPALGLGTVERMAGVPGQRMAVNLQFMQQAFQRRARSGSDLRAGVVDSEKNAAIIPAGKGEATKTQPHFPGLRHRMRSYSLRRHRNDSIQRGPSLLEEAFRFSMRDQPGLQVTCAPWIDLFEDVQRWIMLVQFHADLGVERSETVGDSAASFLRKNDANTGNRSTSI